MCCGRGFSVVFVQVHDVHLSLHDLTGCEYLRALHMRREESEAKESGGRAPTPAASEIAIEYG